MVRVKRTFEEKVVSTRPGPRPTLVKTDVEVVVNGGGTDTEELAED